MNQMRVDIEHKLADIELKRTQQRWQPLKAMAAAFGAGAAAMGAAVALAATVMRHFS